LTLQRRISSFIENMKWKRKTVKSKFKETIKKLLIENNAKNIKIHSDKIFITNNVTASNFQIKI
jgi:hypothetical protein